MTKQDRRLSAIFAFALLCNFLLFGVKLYIGLSVNSICIWSDAINNLFDALSCLLTLVGMALAQKAGQTGAGRVETKAEQLLSFILALIVAAVGFSFAYSSLERFFYPTPVWFSMKYFYLVLATALAKLGLFFFFRRQCKTRRLSVLRVMRTDSLLDFFVTLSTLLSFTLTRYLSFAVDAVFGLGISIVILIQAVRMIVAAVGNLLDYVPLQCRTAVETLVSSCEVLEKTEKIRYYKEEGNEIFAYVKAQFRASPDDPAVSEALSALCAQCETQTGVHLCFILR